MENRSIPVCIHKNKQLVISGAIKPTKCYFIQDWVPEVISIADCYIPAESSNSRQWEEIQLSVSAESIIYY